jgi:hypothetical protein
VGGSRDRRRREDRLEGIRAVCEGLMMALCSVFSQMRVFVFILFCFVFGSSCGRTRATGGVQCADVIFFEDAPPRRR